MKELGYIQIRQSNTCMMKGLTKNATIVAFYAARDMHNHTIVTNKKWKIVIAEELHIKLNTVEKCIKELKDAKILIPTQFKALFKISKKLFGTTHL